MMIPKHTRIEMPKLRRSAKVAPYCFGCKAYNNGDCVLAHANWSEYHKGKGIKVSDVFGAILCNECHNFVDNRVPGNGTTIERKELWLRAHIETLYWWVMTGQLRT